MPEYKFELRMLHGKEIDHEYVLYVDEAGDPGIERVRPIDDVGSTEWFVLAGFLVRKGDIKNAIDLTRACALDLKIQSRKGLHFRKLSDHRKTTVCRSFASIDARIFVVASNKKNMRRYRNSRAATASPFLTSSQVMYNFCVRLLLERASSFVEKNSTLKFGSPRRLRVAFSKRGGHNYGQLFAYLSKALTQSRAGTLHLQKRDLRWKVLDRRLFDVKPDYFYEAFQLADVAASSFYQAVNTLDAPNNTSFAELLFPLLAKEGGKIADFGLTLQPRPQLAALNEYQKKIFKSCGYSF